MSDKANISVCICTYNRAASLARTLDSLLRLRVDDGARFEIVICQNNCADNTAGIIASFQSNLPIKAICEKRQGLSHARNAALGASSGDLVIFTDDDIRVSPDWLSLYARASREHPEASFFGGPIEPLFVQPPPSWLTPQVREMLSGLLGSLTLGSRDRYLDRSDELPYGANMAFRRAALNGFTFDPNLGVKGKKPLVGEETDLMERLLNSAHRGWYIAGAGVQHEVPPNRLTGLYIFKHALGRGRTMVRRGQYTGLRDNRWRVPIALKALRNYFAGRRAKDPVKWVTGLQTSGLHLGQLLENVRH